MHSCIALLGALIFAGSAAAQGERFNYFCSGYPVMAGKELVVTAMGADGSTEKATVSKPGGQYYLVALKLRTGVAYDIAYELGGKVVHTDSQDEVQRESPARARIKEIQFDRVPKMKNAPTGMVPLQARAQGAASAGQPVMEVSSKDGGKHQNSTRILANGLGFVYVKPGHTYTLRYKLGSDLYSKTGLVPNDGSVPPVWELVKEHTPPPPPEPDCEVGAPCNDGDQTTTQDIYLADCSCRGTKKTCEPGARCDDGDPETIGETYDAKCKCVGGVAKPDCLGVPGGDARPGESCDDGDPKTVNDRFTRDCKCVGTSLEPDCLGEPGGPARKGASCDDGNPETTRDAYGPDCVCRGVELAGNASLPVVEDDSSLDHQCSNLHVLVTGKPRAEWKIGDVDEVKMEVDRRVYTGTYTQGQPMEASGDSLRGLIYVNDSLWLELTSPDESFEITAGRNNRHRSIRETSPLRFDWTVKAVKLPSEVNEDMTVLKLTSYTLDCNGTGLVEFNTVEYKVKLTEVFDLMKWLQDHIAAIGGILAGIAVIINYFKGWFAGLFKRTKDGAAQA